ncbi:MAG: hypothetical protein ACK5WR_22135, partial [Planctomycetaceae bacterium]
MLKIIQAKIDFPDHPSIDAVFRHWFSDPDDLPDLSRLSSPGGNSRPGGDCQLPFQPPVSGRLARALLSSAQGLGSAADLGSPSTEGQAECSQPPMGGWEHAAELLSVQWAGIADGSSGVYDLWMCHGRGRFPADPGGRLSDVCAPICDGLRSP